MNKVSLLSDVDLLIMHLINYCFRARINLSATIFLKFYKKVILFIWKKNMFSNFIHLFQKENRFYIK